MAILVSCSNSVVLLTALWNMCSSNRLKSSTCRFKCYTDRRECGLLEGQREAHLNAASARDSRSSGGKTSQTVRRGWSLKQPRHAASDPGQAGGPGGEKMQQDPRQKVPTQLGQRSTGEPGPELQLGPEVKHSLETGRLERQT